MISQIIFSVSPLKKYHKLWFVTSFWIIIIETVNSDRMVFEGQILTRQFLRQSDSSFVILWFQKRPSSLCIELSNWMLFQLLFCWPNHLVYGSLKIELCQVEIENTSSDVLMLEYQVWFKKYSVTYGLISLKLKIFPAKYKLINIIKSIKACSRSSNHSAEWKFNSGLVLNWCSLPDWSSHQPIVESY